MARREAKAQAPTKAPATPLPPPEPALPGSRKFARAARLEARREDKFKEHNIQIREPYEKGGTWRVLANNTLIGEPRSQRKAHQHIRNVRRRGR